MLKTSAAAARCDDEKQKAWGERKCTMSWSTKRGWGLSSFRSNLKYYALLWTATHTALSVIHTHTCDVGLNASLQSINQDASIPQTTGCHVCSWEKKRQLFFFFCCFFAVVFNHFKSRKTQLNYRSLCFQFFAMEFLPKTCKWGQYTVFKIAWYQLPEGVLYCHNPEESFIAEMLLFDSSRDIMVCDCPKIHWKKFIRAIWIHIFKIKAHFTL